jgi:hypothetical protein
MYEVPSTKYQVRSRNRKYEIPAAAGRRGTKLKPMSNAERRVLNVELGKLVSSVIRHPSLASCLPAAAGI